MMMSDREAKELEIRNLSWKRFWPLVLTVELTLVIDGLGLSRFFNPEFECLGRVVAAAFMEVEALGCPVWFSATPLWVWIAIFIILGAANHYAFNKLAPQIKQLREELAEYE